MARPDKKNRKIKNAVLTILLLMTVAASSYSVYVLYTSARGHRTVSDERARGMFNVFVYTYLNEIHPRKAPGKEWRVKSVDIQNKNYAVVETTDGETTSVLEFIYYAEGDAVRVLQLNDITGRDKQNAQLALIRFLSLLEEEQYGEAARFYIGPVSRLLPYAPLGSGMPEQLAGYCRALSPTHRCLRFDLGEARGEAGSEIFQIVVHYFLPDGSPHILHDGTRDFTAIARKAGGNEFLILTLPFD